MGAFPTFSSAASAPGVATIRPREKETAFGLLLMVVPSVAVDCVERVEWQGRSPHKGAPAIRVVSYI
jgi:hypothetical protein